MTEGFRQGVSQQPFYQYSILDLKTDLSQRGNSSRVSLGSFPLAVGDVVKGVCCYDKEEHRGTITSFYRDERSELVYIYILSDLCEKLPLFPDTVSRVVRRHKGPAQSASARSGARGLLGYM